MTSRATSALGIESRFTPSSARSLGQAISRSPGHQHEPVVVVGDPHHERLHDRARLDAAGRGRLLERPHRPVPGHRVRQAERLGGRDRPGGVVVAHGCDRSERQRAVVADAARSASRREQRPGVRHERPGRVRQVRVELRAASSRHPRPPRRRRASPGRPRWSRSSARRSGWCRPRRPRGPAAAARRRRRRAPRRAPGRPTRRAPRRTRITPPAAASCCDGRPVLVGRAPVHVDPAGRVAHQHRGGRVQQVVPPYDGPLGSEPTTAPARSTRATISDMVPHPVKAAPRRLAP